MASTQDPKIPPDGEISPETARELAKRISVDDCLEAIRRAIRTGTTEDYRAAQIAQVVLKAAGTLGKAASEGAREAVRDPKALASEVLRLLEDPDIKEVLTSPPERRG